jgi:multiple sugar transport system permease protein
MTTASTARPKTARRVGMAALVVVLLAPGLFVFFWMVSSSLKVGVDIYADPPHWFDFEPTLDNYRTAFSRTPFVRHAFNSLLIATASALIGLVIGVPAAYTIARYNQRRLALTLLTARLMPGVGYLVPLFILFTRLGLVGSYPALIVSHLVVTFPLSVYIMVNFFEGVPTELYDAALVDGCSKVGAFRRVALPLTKPGLVTAGVLAFIFSWNDFKMALILSNATTKTLPVAVYNFVHEASLEWGPMMAYATVVTIPVIVLTAVFQRHIITGMTLGSIK